jgi:prepilin-type N-terminal cleavage/methylation domain-containing protein
MSAEKKRDVTMKIYLFEKRDVATRNRVLSSARSRQAFTLIELIVVLTILVGLAGILIPTVTNMVERTSRSSTASNLTEISGAVQRFESIYMRYPNYLDSLMQDATGTDLNTLYTSLTSITEDVTLSANTLATLNNAGITSVGLHALDDTTFNLPTQANLTATTQLKGLTAAAQVTLGLETTGAAGKYIVLGLGSRTDLVGRAMLDAPVYFPRDAATNPHDVYSRFLTIFQITDGTDALSRARFIGVLAPDGTNVSSQLSGYFTTANIE